MPARPNRGDVWYADLDPVVGHEQAGHRPVVIVSTNILNQSEGDLAIVIPITSKLRSVRSRIKIDPPNGGISRPSQIQVDQIRSISTLRLDRRIGRISGQTMGNIEAILSILLELP